MEKTFKKIDQYKFILTNDDLTMKLSLIFEEERKKMVIPVKLQNIYDMPYVS